MRQLVCDKCGKTSKSLHIFKIEFEGAPSIGGSSLTWDGPRGIMDHGGRRNLELCWSCARAFVNVHALNTDASADLREALAEYAHAAWSGWMDYMFEMSGGAHLDGTLAVPADLTERWKRQMTTPYSELSAGEKDSDRDEADKMLAIVGTHEGD